MACSECRSGRTARLIMSAAVRAPQMIYALASYPDCATPHPADGTHAGDSLYVVGRGTRDEMIFRRSNLAEASRYARDVNKTLENIPTTALCDQAVLDVFQR